MPRRRLHGETQKRRKKPRTRLLKRSDSPVRVQSTQQPAPFERSGQVEREDLEFLEAMRELDVERSPWRGDAPVRRQVVERVQFLAEDGEQALFRQRMAHLGVNPLDGSALPSVPAADRAPSAADPDADEGAPEPDADAAGVHAAPMRDEGRVAPAPATPPAEPLEFEGDEDARALMEALLRDEAFAPEHKFAGATAAPRRVTRGNAGPRDDLEPDDELDLHGKTQEEAIRMVQGFLVLSTRRRLRHVLIITGRGLNSGPGGPVLKDAVQRWLDLNGTRYVRGVIPAPPRHGGAGALWLTLR